jgi:hypothetical protein
LSPRDPPAPPGANEDWIGQALRKHVLADLPSAPGHRTDADRRQDATVKALEEALKPNPLPSAPVEPAKQDT